MALYVYTDSKGRGKYREIRYMLISPDPPELHAAATKLRAGEGFRGDYYKLTYRQYERAINELDADAHTLTEYTMREKRKEYQQARFELEWD